MRVSGRAAFAIVLLMFSIIILVVGAYYLDDCPVEKMIPIFLVVTGVVGVFLVLLTLLQRYCFDEDMETDLNCFRLVILVFMLFWSAWFIAGSFWVYSNYQPRYNAWGKNSTDYRYCNKVLYLVSFWSINLTYMFFTVMLIAILFIFIFMPDTWSQIWGY